MLRKANSGTGRLGNKRGQSLVLAIIVMFLLVFIGVIFVLVVARNQGRASRSTDVLAAQYIAEAGINYADQMLRSSEKGADWRPTPDNMGFDVTWPAGVPVYTPKTNLAYWKTNPDFQWLRPYSPVESGNMGPTGGYTKFEMGKGRYLLRVSYNPDPGVAPDYAPKDPMSKFIKIECIGRIGQVLDDDPTTWNSQRLRRELTAYKPIGLTDYLRFEANREHRQGEIALGAPGVPITYGEFFKADPTHPETSPIRVNGNLTWYGKSIDLYMRARTYTSDSGAVNQIPMDAFEVAGEIKHNASDNPAVHVNSVVDDILVPDPGSAAPTLDPVTGSDSLAKFLTYGGVYRDGSEHSGDQGSYRSIKRLEPPMIDANTPNNVPRYLALTRDSGEWVQRKDTSWVNTGRYGWGQGIYIDNRDDLQPESESLMGGYTPRMDWMKPNNNVSAYWQGPYYVPPAVIITLNPYDTDGDGKPDITITRTDVRGRGANSGKKPIWFDAAGKPITGYNPVSATPITGQNVGSTITVPYPQGTQTFYYWYDDTNGDGVPQMDELKSIDIARNGVIYADGNVRIRGMLAENTQLTVVSGGIIYVDGNLMKYRYPPDNKGNVAVDDRCAISLLAKEYVCVNTTQFMGLMNSVSPTLIGSNAGTGEAPYHLIITPDPATVFNAIFSFGAPPPPADKLWLFCRHAGQYGASYINMWLNRTLLDIGQGLSPAGIPTYVYGVGDLRYNNSGAGTDVLFEHKVWNFGAVPGTNLNTNVGIPNYVEVALDQSSVTRSNYLLSAFVIQPFDITIEAVMFAQNRSFYMIPGNWFNMDPNDLPGNKFRPRGVDPMWPCFGQPLDTRINVTGAITEDLPAPIADVNEWYSKWSGIPEFYGSSTEKTLHYDGNSGYGEGIRFRYDRKLSYPVYIDKSSNPQPIRKDEYGRPLPITPCLPVCESLIYYGETG